jgi:hypothetical protein
MTDPTGSKTRGQEGISRLLALVAKAGGSGLMIRRSMVRVHPAPLAIADDSFAPVRSHFRPSDANATNRSESNHDESGRDACLLQDGLPAIASNSGDEKRRSLGSSSITVGLRAQGEGEPDAGMRAVHGGRLGLTVVLLAAVGAGYEAIREAQDRLAYPMPGRLFDVAGPGSI